jgi:NADH-quinone oxidoreductase subunit L
MFHLMTHAFFKALLFLGAGSVIHAMSDEQDMRNMGGIWRKIPWTYALMWIGSLALAGIPFFAGYFSKDMVLEAAWADHSSHGLFAYWMGVTAAFLTAFYSWRLLIMTFHGKSRANEKVLSHVHESPAIMILPLLVLATGAIGAGYVFYDWFVGEGRHEFWAQSLFVLAGNDTIEAAHHVPLWVKKAPLVAAVSGIVLATFIYGFGGGIAAGISRIFRPIYVLFFNKYYIDELYNTLFLKPSLWLGRFFFTKGDGSMINGLGPDGLARWSGNIASRLSKFQSGYVYHYVFVMIIGLLVCVSWVFYRLVLSS